MDSYPLPPANPSALSSFSNDPICLVVEDDEQVVEVLSEMARQHGFRSIHAGLVRDAMNFLRKQKPDLLLLDHSLPDGFGGAVFEQAIALYPSLRCIMLTGFPTIQEAVRLTQRGLLKYLQKPFNLSELAETIDEVAILVRQERSLDSRQLLFTHSPQMRRVLEALRMVAPHWHAAVLLSGETGTGKEVCAATLHDLTWKDKNPRPPIIPVNCAAIPQELLESELFGATQGSFTGAHRNRPGLVATAEGGTLFLDEIGEMPLALQGKLLRFLETREYRQLGSTTFKEFSGRIILATNRDLRAEVERGRFREDLFHRLNVMNIHLPPLRERTEDILPLAMHFLENICRHVGRPILSIPTADLNRLCRLPLPGNARELRNLIEKAVIQTPLNASTLSLQLDQHVTENHPPFHSASDQSFGSLAAFLSQIDADARKENLTRLETAEAILIRESIRRHQGNLAESARWLGVSRPALYRKLKRLHISRTP